MVSPSLPRTRLFLWGGGASVSSVRSITDDDDDDDGEKKLLGDGCALPKVWERPGNDILARYTVAEEQEGESRDIIQIKSFACYTGAKEQHQIGGNLKPIS